VAWPPGKPHRDISLARIGRRCHTFERRGRSLNRGGNGFLTPSRLGQTLLRQVTSANSPTFNGTPNADGTMAYQIVGEYSLP